MNELLYGVAYYDEYMPTERLETDIAMMKAAGINLVRIAESTWSTHEPQNGVFDFTSVDRVLDAMYEAGIKVIVGTPTYAVPTWMVREHPEVLAETPKGLGRYGARQIMDITSPVYLFYAERIIRKLIGRVCAHPAVIGYQIDNETKHYHTSGPNVQLRFVKYVREKFGTLERLNKEFGLDYWSNRINSWEDFPSVVGTINGSLGAEFARFQRGLVTEFLAWQAAIVGEYKQPGQFVTHNFDFEWRGYSFGVQPDVNHLEASKSIDIAGVDIYHPSQADLTGKEIAFGGDSTRSLKGANYFVLETQAQAFPDWTPYPGQLRLQAFSHVASGANMVEYWHWHSIHNSFETYWKGLLSHDLGPNPTYNEAKTVGADFRRLSPQLANLRKTNRAAVLVSNEAYTAMEWFPLPGRKFNYNDVVRLMYDALYELNIECDVINASEAALDKYDLLVVPALYAAPDELLARLNEYVHNGGHVVYTFKSGFTNDNVQVRSVTQPGMLSEACGIQYSQFVEPNNVTLKGDPFEVGAEHNQVHTWMELIEPTTAEVLAWYDHPHWGSYAAVTENRYGQGKATYIGCFPSAAVASKVLERAAKAAGLWGADQENQFPLIVKSGVNDNGRTVRFYFNYSDASRSFVYPRQEGRELLAGDSVATGQRIELARWGFVIIEEG
ncbi:beta-galactosidase [Paenibacillus phyllosphaerae]|uniref:Beta-galactosidase n=1 Tax=Paenibacillus phyllosphaerae TaxID=274593 RepID=A0A7W5FPI0_9BACL|nr:beta-galactosidase [Paenibacillus phyllosphaerae]MBB3112375.1 beta-galactosidase [Paenibacillus phyllosphaerae]